MQHFDVELLSLITNQQNIEETLDSNIKDEVFSAKV